MSTTTPAAFPEAVSHHDVRRLSSHTRETEHLVHCLGHPTSEVVSDLLGGSLDRLRFVAVETGGADELLQVAPIRMGEIGRLGKTSEQGGRYFVDPLIRALSGQNGCDQQFERRPVIEGGSGPRKFLAELADDLAGAPPAPFLGFAAWQLRAFCQAVRLSGCQGGRKWLDNVDLADLADLAFRQPRPSRRPLRP